MSFDYGYAFKNFSCFNFSVDLIGRKLVSVFVLFEEEDVIKEFARRGFNESRYNIHVTNKMPVREPQIGWKCKRCGKVMKLSNAEDGNCKSCLSVDLEHIFGEEQYNTLFRKRKQELKNIRQQITRE